MKTNHVRALLINDFDPAESKGAASVALDLASRIFEDKDFAYLCTSKQATSRQEFHNIRFEYLPETWIDQVRDKVRSYFPALEGLMRVLVIRRLWRIFWSAKKLSPKIVWVHQIGWRIPILSLLILRALRKPIFLTIHDYTYLRFRKLYPNDFDHDVKSFENELDLFHIDGSSLKSKLITKESLFHKFTRLIISKTCEIIYISDLQSAIYTSAGYPSGVTINNSVRKCSCGIQKMTNDARVGDLSVLFAGRFIGKGLERVVESILKTDRVHLHLAGGHDLMEYVLGRLPSHRFTYHGFLDEKELAKLIHAVHLTAVASACFDVFPTIAIESISHGTPVISTPTTGVFNLSRRINRLFGLTLNGDIPFEILRELAYSESVRANLELIKEEVTSPITTTEYRSVFCDTDGLTRF